MSALGLALDAFFDRAARRLGRGAFLLCDGRASEQLGQPRQRIIAVLFLTAIALRLDDDHAVAGNASILQLSKFVFENIRQ